MRNAVRLGGVFDVRCFDRKGNLKWQDKARNLVVNEGLDHILTVLFTGAGQMSKWYVGLTGATPSPAAGHSLATHEGWTEVTDYSENRKEFIEGDVLSQSISNAASKASFAIDYSVTIGGAFLASVASGTEGVLLSVAAFSGGNKSADEGDTLEVQYTFSAADGSA